MNRKDQIDLVDKLSSKYEGKAAKLYLDAAKKMRDAISLQSLIDALQSNNEALVIEIVKDAQDSVIDDLALLSLINSVYMEAGAGQAAIVSQSIKQSFSFMASTQRVTDYLRSKSIKRVVEITNQQREALREIMAVSVERNWGKKKTAHELKNVIGLTARQVRAIENYRKELEEGSKSAIDRALRDKRFDSSILSQTELSPEKIDKMVEAYRHRMLNYRVKQLAENEVLQAISVAQDEAMQQAVQSGRVPRTIKKYWHHRADSRVRDSHVSTPMLNSGGVAFNGLFRTGNGNLLRFPRDPSAPADDVVNCRCYVAYR